MSERHEVYKPVRESSLSSGVFLGTVFHRFVDPGVMNGEQSAHRGFVRHRNVRKRRPRAQGWRELSTMCTSGITPRRRFSHDRMDGWEHLLAQRSLFLLVLPGVTLRLSDRYGLFTGKSGVTMRIIARPNLTPLGELRALCASWTILFSFLSPEPLLGHTRRCTDTEYALRSTMYTPRYTQGGIVGERYTHHGTPGVVGRTIPTMVHT